MRIAWVHPSWRDVVIDELAGDGAARRRFIAGAGPDGIALALSVGGGTGGERRRPLLREDADWDALTDRICVLLPDLDDAALAVLLASLRVAVEDSRQRRRGEAGAVAGYVVDRVRRGWDRAREPIPLDPLQAWLELREALTGDEHDDPDFAVTWTELAFTRSPHIEDATELARFDDWLRLAELIFLHTHGKERDFGYSGAYEDALTSVADQIVFPRNPHEPPPADAALVIAVAKRLTRVWILRREHLIRAEGIWLPAEPLPSSPREPPARIPPGDGQDADETVRRILRDL